MKNKNKYTYYERYKDKLVEILGGYNNAQTELFSQNTYSIFNTLETGITKHPLRQYQKDALYILDYIFATSQAEMFFKTNIPNHRIIEHINHLLEIVDIDSKKMSPFLGFEMATGSGKTMLMGAAIYLLNKKYNIKNFLIITPASTDIYEKTIRNFQIGNYDSVWADDTPFTFNLVTGDNYSQDLFFNEDKDANVFIFNISKFGTNATNTSKTWESAKWKDEDGNNISIKQYLKNKKLVIITDEAHHAQNRKSKEIIMSFHPDLVLEYTATAIEDDSGDEKRNQTVVYKYDIKHFLEDGYGKLVRAVALMPEEKKRKNEEIAQSEKFKIITLFLIHILKKKAIAMDNKIANLKPISFIKVKDDTIFTEKIYKYIINELSADIENIEIILDKLKDQELNITELLIQMFKGDFNSSISKLRQEINHIAQTTIFYYGESDKETEKKFREIKYNDTEIVVYMQRLDEGIDIPNIYTMAVIKDTASDFKTSVKQIIGRGVRLSKNVREFDESENSILKQTEMLHIVCDQGKNFEEQILAIQKEFGLTDKYISSDKPRKSITNKVKKELLNQKYIPHIRADFKVKENIALLPLVNDVETITNSFLEENCFHDQKSDIKKFIKYKPDTFFLEVDIFADEKEFHKQLQQSGGTIGILKFADKELKQVYGRAMKNLHCLPDTAYTKNAFSLYLEKLNGIGLQYYKLTDSDDKLAMNLFVDSFSHFYRNHIEKNYFSIDFREVKSDEAYNLINTFREYEMKIPEDQINNEKWKKFDSAKILNLVSSGYSFFGYEKAIYDYNSFDSFPEKQLADIVNDYLYKEKDNANLFWIRNQRQIHFSYGSKKYYPDFIIGFNDVIYVVETKGEIFSDTKKSVLLQRLDQIPGYKSALVYSQQMDIAQREKWDFAKLISQAEKSLKKQHDKQYLLEDAPEELRFVKYIPVYSPINAYKKFIKENKTAKSDSWLSVPEKTEKYPETVFAIQIKGEALYPLKSNNDWIIFDSSFDTENIKNQVCLVYSKKVKFDDNEYDPCCTIRKFEMQEKKSKNTLLPEYQINLTPINQSTKEYTIEQMEREGDFSIVGTEYITESKENFVILPEVSAELQYTQFVPVYELEAACGLFGNSVPAEPKGWTKIVSKTIDKTMFVSKVLGHSMEPRIHDGDYCLFRSNVIGSRQGKIVLVQHNSISDPETGGTYTVKKYTRKKVEKADETWEHKEIILEPINPAYASIIIPNAEENEFAIIAEFVETINR